MDSYDGFAASGAASPKRSLGASRGGSGLDAMATQPLGMTQGPTLRQQLDALSMTVHEIAGRVEMSGRDIVNLQEDRDRLKQVIQTQDDILNARILSECTACREDANHKFALQVAENKRLQAQLAKAQADVQRLTRIVENLTTRMSMVETNCGFQ